MLAALDTRGFRNLASGVWAPGPGSHLVLGPNGAGKTSVLEAVYLLATTRSFRTHRLDDCCRHDAAGFHLRGEVEKAAPVRLELGWSRAERRRERAVNGSETSLAEHLAVLPVLSWTSADATVLTGPPRERRRLMDRGIVGLRPASLDALARYRKTLAEKRELLQSGRGPLEPWNELLAVAAADVIARRAAFVEELTVALAAVLGDCDLGLPEIRLRYRPSPREGLDGAAALAAKLAAVAPRERAMEQPMIGPHRDDLHVTWGGRPIAEVASAGERKALGMALLEAQARLLERAERAPLLLLDDADVELDPQRLERLWRAFTHHPQLIASSNRPAVWTPLHVDHCWHVRAGVLTPA